MERSTVVNMHCVIPKANANEEKQTLLAVFCTLLGGLLLT